MKEPGLGAMIGRPIDTQTESLGLASIMRSAEDRLCDQTNRANLRERIVQRATSAHQKANELHRLNRLAELIEKHPDFCELIDLLQGFDLF